MEKVVTNGRAASKPTRRGVVKRHPTPEHLATALRDIEGGVSQALDRLDEGVLALDDLLYTLGHSMVTGRDQLDPVVEAIRFARSCLQGVLQENLPALGADGVLVDEKPARETAS